MATTTSTPDHETYTVAELEPVNVPELQDKVRLNTVRVRCWAEGIIAGLNLLDWHVREYPIKEPEDLRGVVTTLEAMFDSGRLAEDAWGISACAVEALVGDTLISALVIQAKAFARTPNIWRTPRGDPPLFFANPRGMLQSPQSVRCSPVGACPSR